MDQQSFVYKFLLAPRFRFWRYIVLILFFSIVSVNQALVGYRDIMPELGNKVYWITLATLLVYIIMVLVLQRIVVKYLLSGKYLKFILFIFVCAIVFEIIPNLTFIRYMDNYDFFSETAIADHISSFVIYLLCISGVTIPIFLRNWLITSQHLNEMEKKQRSSKIEKLKEQVNPASFFKVLSRSADLVKPEPDKASKMLMKLSQLLRYQLYDCNRDMVLLTAEISFIRNYLELENLYSGKLNYTLGTTGNVNGIFMPPSILLPYVQTVINCLEMKDHEQATDIQLDVNDEYISFIIQISGLQSIVLLEKELLKIRERLNMLYKEHYRLTVINNKEDNKTEVCLQLDKK